MANTVPVRGLDPEWHSSTPPLCDVTLLPPTAVGAYPLFINSAVTRSVGFLIASLGAQTGAAATDEAVKCTGAITMIYDAAGAPAHNYALGAGGKAEHTISASQRFRATMNSTGYTAIETGNMYNLDAEGQVAGVAGSLTSTSMGGHFSDRQLAGATEQASTANKRMFTVMGLTPTIYGNDVATLNTELWVVITPTLHQP